MELNALYTAPIHEDGAEVQLKDPVTGDLLDCWIRVQGVDSKSFRESTKKMKRHIVEAVRDKKDIDEDEYLLIVDCSIGWRGFESDGEEVPFSKDAVRELYENSPAIAQQVDAFILDRRNFTKG